MMRCYHCGEGIHFAPCPSCGADVPLKSWTDAEIEWRDKALASLKEDIRFLLKFVPAPPWPGISETDEAIVKILEHLYEIRKKVT